MRAKLLISAIAALGWLHSSAMAQQVCTTRADLVKMLGDKYQELPVGNGLVNDKAVIEVYVSNRGSFTILSSYTNGVSCIVAAGNNWEVMELPKAVTAL